MYRLVKSTELQSMISPSVQFSFFFLHGRNTLTHILFGIIMYWPEQKKNMKFAKKNKNMHESCNHAT